jgi:hypothetical protein
MTDARMQPKLRPLRQSRKDGPMFDQLRLVTLATFLLGAAYTLLALVQAS